MQYQIIDLLLSYVNKFVYLDVIENPIEYQYELWNVWGTRAENWENLFRGEGHQWKWAPKGEGHTLFSAIQGEGHTFSRIFNGDFCDVIFHFSLTD